MQLPLSPRGILQPNNVTSLQHDYAIQLFILLAWLQQLRASVLLWSVKLIFLQVLVLTLSTAQDK